MTVKITGLSKLNVAALRETMPGAFVLTATTASSLSSAQNALAAVEATIASLSGGNAHPRGSLRAVARKLRAQVLNGRQDVPSEPVKPASPAVEMCPNSGISHPGSRRLYDTCRDCGKQGKVTSTGVLRAHAPQAVTLENLLTY